VEKAAVSSRTAEVAASELATYLNSLPRLLTENLTVTVGGGTGEMPYIHEFYGPGTLSVSVKAGATATLAGLYLENNRAAISVKGFRLQSAAPSWNTFVTVSHSTQATLSECAVVGPGGSFDAVSVSMGTLLLSKCDFTGLNRVLIPAEGAVVSVMDCTGSGNTVGIFGAGGAVLLSGSTPPLLGGASNGRYNGGLIVKKDGTLL